MPLLSVARLASPAEAAMAVTQTKEAFENAKCIARGVGWDATKRPAAWLALTGGAILREAAAPGHYNRLASDCGAVPEQLLEVIDQDAPVLCARMPGLATSRSTEALSRIIVAAAAHCPHWRHTRALSTVAAFLLSVCGPSAEGQEMAFWTLVGLLYKLFPYCAGQLTVGARVEQAALAHLTAKKSPRVMQHLARSNMDLALYTAAWFQTLFVGVLPHETALRVMDCLVTEGSKVLSRVALALIKKYEATLLLDGGSGAEVSRKVMELRVTRTTDANELLSLAFRGIGSLPGSVVAAARGAAVKELQLPSVATAAAAAELPPVPVAPAWRQATALAAWASARSGNSSSDDEGGSFRSSGGRSSGGSMTDRSSAPASISSGSSSATTPASGAEARPSGWQLLQSLGSRRLRVN